METETVEPVLGENGTMAQMAAGTGLKINVARDELVAKLGIVSAPSRREAPCRCSPGSCSAPTARR